MDSSSSSSQDDGQKLLGDPSLLLAAAAAAREERATSTVQPSSQQAATSTSDLLGACESCPLVVWQCRRAVPPRRACAGACGDEHDDEDSDDGQAARASPPESGRAAAAVATATESSAADARSLGCGTEAQQPDMCRICHCPDADPAGGDNPLISPCLCSGSLKYVHRDCLQRWVKSQDIKVCELCKFGFVMRVTTKPIGEWRKLDMSSVERRKIICSVSFHVIALTCVIWSLYVLIDKTSAEINSGKLEWPFWTKLVVVAIGFTGGIVFMYVQCRTYFSLCRRWRSFNRTFLIQSASEEELSRARAVAKARPARCSSGCSDELV